MNLPQEVQSQLTQVAGGPPFPWVWLATQDAEWGAQVRTVRLLAYNFRSGIFHFASHREHSKHEQIRFDQRGQLCFLRQEPLLQVRLQCLLKSGPASQFPAGPRFWARLPGPDKLRLYQSHPQAPTPPDTFWVVECQAVAVECLDLGPEPRRELWSRQGQDWLKQIRSC